MRNVAQLNVVVLIALALHATSLSADSTAQSLAVIDFEGKGIAAQEASVLSDQFREALHKTNAFVVLERSAMDAVLREQGFQQSGCVSTECAIEVGQMIGVKYMAAGSVGKLGDVYVVSVRVIEVASGIIKKSHSTEVRGAISDLLGVLPYLAAAIAETRPAQQAARDSQREPKMPAKREPAKPRRSVEVLIGAGGVYGSGGVKMRVDSVVYSQPYTVTRLGQYTNATAQTIGVSIGAGLLFKRASLNLQVLLQGPITTTLRFNGPSDTSSFNVDIERKGGGLTLSAYYEPLFFRERYFSLAPGLAGGFLSMRDEISSQDYSHESVDVTRFGSLNAKMRVGGMRVFATLEYAFTFGEMEKTTQVGHWISNTARCHSTYESGMHNSLMLSLVVRI